MTYPPIMHRPAFEAFVRTLPAATIVHQWRDDSVAKVGGKIFCLLDRDPGEIWLKVPDMSFDLMIEMDGIRPAPYFARAGWVAISHESALGEDDLRAYITEAHRLVASKLSRRLRSELGLDAP
ncbi:Predicted DNA-binding protein, MmcQ/YjbR family [Devosia lucknowensis]|uniref:Predicted DNA-binding protein, MmcQ/YjbR family n=1 Tax=Devosia lucknowensis TaxID=1096929 RepID=A0A1Y6G8M3_9HYPH|nr:MmcQ/YjbR family DNA-binding protein [Devosia lucknowensis]SMQ85683.1 Predicted DNA-binding protein, MmcQ/YjbR family [Devosia lucknowensis]